MPDQQETTVIIKRVNQLLTAAMTRGIRLTLAGSRFEDGWLYLVVEPGQPGERASQHAHLLTEIERNLQKEGFEQVLLVPAIPEHAGLIDPPTAN